MRKQLRSRSARLQHGFGIHLAGFPFDAPGLRLQPVSGTAAAQIDRPGPRDAAAIQTGVDIGELGFARIPKQVGLQIVRLLAGQVQRADLHRGIHVAGRPATRAETGRPRLSARASNPRLWRRVGMQQAFQLRRVGLRDP